MSPVVSGCGDKLKIIAAKCGASVSLEYRSYSFYYEKIEDLVTKAGDDENEYEHAGNFLDGELDKCVETDQYWCLHFYPRTPVAFHHAFSHDLDKLLDWALDILEGVE